MEVEVTNRNLEMAIKVFRKKTQRENIIKEARLRQAHEKPYQKRRRKSEESVARRKKRKREMMNQQG